jgi:hypothetical protein
MGNEKKQIRNDHLYKVKHSANDRRLTIYSHPNVCLWAWSKFLYALNATALLLAIEKSYLNKTKMPVTKNE